MTLFWVVFLTAGLIGMTFGASLALTGLRSTRWPRAVGRVASSEVVSEPSPGGDGTTHSPLVTYTYSVEGREYTGRRISVGDHGSGDRARARKISDKYIPDTQVVVFYNPEDPGDALLNPGFHISAVLIFLLGAFFFTAAVLGLCGVIGKS